MMSTGIALVILGIPAACIGAVLPLMIRSLSEGGRPFGAGVGALLTWNTLGAVTGTLLTGFFLMPRFGLRNTFGILAMLLASMALVIALRKRWPAGISLASVSCFLALCLLAVSDVCRDSRPNLRSIHVRFDA